jgi:hypothetical protein
LPQSGVATTIIKEETQELLKHKSDLIIIKEKKKLRQAEE